MDFITQYLEYNKGNMSPRRFHIWSALSILAMTMGRKIYIDHSYFIIHPMLYICLVGRQGLRKTTAMNNARDLFLRVFPTYPLGASVQSREKIVERLASNDSMRSYQNELGESIEFRPTAFFINELKNFMSINPGAMVEFLTDIYDTKFFASDTIKHGLQPVINPCINILACETPKWLVEKLKLNIIAGGFSRRMLYAYETVRPARITFPHKSVESAKAEAWCEEHLAKIGKLAGPFKWTPEARTYFDKWFTSLATPEDEILEGFYEAKDILALKISMLVAVAKEQPDLLLTQEILQLGIAILESLEDNLPKLTVAAGRNELAIPQQGLLDLLEEKGGGWMPEKVWHREASKQMNEFEYMNTKKMLKDTDQLYEFPFEVEITGVKVKKMMIATHRKYAELIKSGELKLIPGGVR